MWGGRPVATSVVNAVPRVRLVTTGVVTAACHRQWAGVPAYACELDDGSGRVLLAFTGRRRPPGLDVGMRCRVEGTAQPDPHGKLLVLWNPIYELLG
jgi:hypothetical protein